jgi:ABC-2 type transport system ATP-binding protein
VTRALGIVGLEHDAHRLVTGYSLGMRQRLAVALTLLAEPALLVLDEPTNGLDPAGIHEMRDLLRGLAKEHGVTVFLSSHLLAEVEQLAGHVGIIDHGRLLFEGTLRDLQSRNADRLSVEVDEPAAALLLLREAGWSAQRGEGQSLLIEYAERADIARVAAALVQSGLSVYQLRTTHASLEDIFLELTGATNPSSGATGAELAR